MNTISPLSTDDQYEDAKEKIARYEYEIKILKGQVLQYENNHKRPSFYLLEAFKDFIHDAEGGEMFEFEDVTYIVQYPLSDLCDDYGSEIVYDKLYEAKDLRPFTGGWFGNIIEKVV